MIFSKRGNRYVSIVTLSILTMMLAACGNDGVWANARDVAASQIFGRGQNHPHTREQINGIPYATILATIENNVPSLMVLGYVDGDKLQWIASDSASIVTQYGRVVRTVGLPNDIQFQGSSQLDILSQNPHHIDNVEKYNLSLEYIDGAVKNVGLACELMFDGEERIEILDIFHDTHRLVEVCESTNDKKIKNIFWVDQTDGFIWRSQQRLLNGNYDIEINVLKRYYP